MNPLLTKVMQKHKRKLLNRRKNVLIYGVEDRSAFEIAITILNQYIQEETLITKLPYTYNSYIGSKPWRVRWTLYREHYKNICQRCFKYYEKDLSLHHLTYDNLRMELPGDLQLVCKRCHYIIENEKRL